MPCIDKIAADILNSCDTIPRGGFETIAWAINREDIDTVTHDITYDTLVTAITMNSLTWAYNVTAVKKEMNAGFDLAVGDDIPDTYLNYFSFKPYEKTAAAIKNLDSMNDLVIIAELKGLKTEGCFVIYGLEKGLYKNSGTQRQNDSNGLPIYEMQSQEGQGERYSRFVFWDTNYATSKAAIEALELTLGPELHTDACAASDPNGNEANAITGWTAENSAELTSENTPVSVGDYTMYVEGTTLPTASSGCKQDFAVDNGDTYRITFDWRHDGTSANPTGDWICQLEASTIATVEKTDIVYASVSYDITMSDTFLTVRFKEDNASNDGGVYFDNLSVRKIL